MSAEITRITTNSPEEWRKLRRKYIGGSDAAAVVGLNYYVSPYSLWMEKTGRAPGFEGNLATEVGTFLEEFVAQKFASETGKRVRKCNQSLLNSQYPFAIANIDREIVGEDAGLEIKTTDSVNMKKFKNGDYPANYYCQCVHYMAITGKKKWYLAVLIGNREFKIFEIERDEEEIRALMAAEEKFFEYVKNDTPPPTDGSKATTDALTAHYPNDNGDAVDLKRYLADLAKYVGLSQQIKDLEAAKDEAGNKIKQYMGEAALGRTADYKVSWKSSKRRTFDIKAFEKANPKIDTSAFYKETTTRTFKVTRM